jgi:CBS domain-containing protein
MHVEEIMTTSVKSCGPDDSLDTAARIMWENDCGCVPVIDQDGRVLAMLTDRDVCMAAYTQGRTLGEIRVSAAMSNACHAVRRNDPVVAAERMMQEHQVRRLPVVDDGRLVGLVSLSDITWEASRETHKNMSDVTLDEVAVTLSAVCQPRSGREPSQTLSPSTASGTMPNPSTSRRQSEGARSASASR